MGGKQDAKSKISFRLDHSNAKENEMDVSAAVAQRRSIRRFTEQPVDTVLLKDILDKARAAPSGGNLQPWHATVVSGASLAKLKQEMRAALMAPPGSEQPEYRIYPENLTDPWRARRGDNGEALYASLGIAREDRAGRFTQLARNFTFFGAPVGLFVHMPAFMGPPQWADLGLWLQTIMLLLVEAGLGSCAQEAWSAYPQTVKRVVQIPEDHMLFCGLAIGWPDGEAEVNGFPNPRASLEQLVRFLD
jgi:nitroreductase